MLIASAGSEMGCTMMKGSGSLCRNCRSMSAPTLSHMPLWAGLNPAHFACSSPAAPCYSPMVIKPLAASMMKCCSNCILDKGFSEVALCAWSAGCRSFWPSGWLTSFAASADAYERGQGSVSHMSLGLAWASVLPDLHMAGSLSQEQGVSTILPCRQ